MKKMMTFTRVRLTFIAAFFCVGFFLWATYKHMRTTESESRNVKSALDVLLRLENILSDVQAIESGQRGFAISGDEKYLEGYTKGLHDMRLDTTMLSELRLSDSTSSEERTNLLQLLNRKIAHSKVLVEVRRIYGYDSTAKLLQTGLGKKMMDSIVSAISKVENQDRTPLQQSNIIREKNATRTTIVFVVLAILFYGFLVYSFITIRKEFLEREATDKTLKYNASLIQNISDPIVTTDSNYIITNWNAYAEELYGYTEAEAKGKKMSELMKIIYNKTPRTTVVDEYLQNDYWKGEVIHHHKNGQPIHVEVSTSAIKDVTGKETGTVAVIRDITERKLLEERLNELTGNLQLQVDAKAKELGHVFERVADAFIALDNNWNYTYLNTKAAQLHGKSPAELIGKNIWKEFPDVMSEPFYKALYTARDTQEPQRLQLYSATTGKWFEDLIYPSPDGISVYYHDITEKKNAALSLEQMHERLNYHINNTPMGVVEFDSKMQIVQWNENAEKIFGWKNNEVMNGRLDTFEFVYGKDTHILADSVAELLGKTSTNNIVHNRNLTKDGRVIHCIWYNSVLRDEEGNTVGIMSLVQDVTSSKHVELELQEAEAKFRSLVEQSMVGVYIVQDEKIIYANPKFSSIFGYEQNEIVKDFDPAQIIPPGQQLKVLSNYRARMEGKVKSLNYEFTGIHKSGRALELEVFGTFTIYEGKPAIIGTLIDITEKKKSIDELKISEEALSISNERFSLVAKATNDAVWDWDMASDQIWGNNIFKTLFGLADDEPLGFSSFVEYLHPDDRKKIIDNFKAALANHDEVIMEEFRLQEKHSNTYRTLYDRAFVIYDEEHKPVRMLGAMQDITEQKEAEIRLMYEKEISDTIINSLPGVFYLYNKQGQFYRWNDNFEKVTGYTAEEIKFLHPVALFTDKEKDLLRSKIANVFENGEDSVEADFMAKDGTLTRYYFTGSVINYEGEICLMGVGMDVSDRVKAQQQLQQSEQKFRTLIEQASDGIFISDVDGNYIDVNSSATLLTGYSKEELLKMNVSDVFFTNDENSHPFSGDQLDDGKPLLNESIIRQKAGSHIHVEISAKLLEDGRYQGIVRDIVARKTAEEELRNSEMKYRLLFEQNPMPMFMLSIPERDFIDVNNAAVEFYGYSREEFLSMNAYDLRSEHETEKLENYYAQNPNGINHAGIWTHLKKDGTEVKMDIITHYITNDGRNARLVLANDVTEKLDAEINLQKSHEQLRLLATHLEDIRESERTHMAREIHDELGQQLTGLKMDIAWLNRKIKSDDLEVQQKIKDTIQLIDTTVITVRRIATELRPSILDDLGLIPAMEWQSEEFQKRSEIETNFVSNLSNFAASPEVATGIFRVYQESLTNVMRHAQASKVEASLNIADDSLELVITDNGKGFLIETISNKRTLGLLGMKERVNLMGGTYEIISAPGHGTSVKINVPLS